MFSNKRFLSGQTMSTTVRIHSLTNSQSVNGFRRFAISTDSETRFNIRSRFSITLGEYVLLLRNCTFQSGDFILAKLPGACFIFCGVLRLVVTFQITFFIRRNSSVTYKTYRLNAKLNEQELFRPTILKRATFAVNFPFLSMTW